MKNKIALYVIGAVVMVAGFYASAITGDKDYASYGIGGGAFIIVLGSI